MRGVLTVLMLACALAASASAQGVRPRGETYLPGPGGRVFAPDLSPETLNLGFNCGPNMVAYQPEVNGVLQNGIRCVRFLPSQRVRSFIWYGEGAWGANGYRHVGRYFPYAGPLAGPPDVMIDLWGNGEHYQNAVSDDFRIRFGEPLNGRPETIRFDLPFQETWRQVVNGVNSYDQRQEWRESCGPRFDHFLVFAGDDASFQSPQGVRCLSRSGFIWYGAGAWNGATYTHVGTIAEQSPQWSAAGQSPGLRALVADVCNGTSYCNTAEVHIRTFCNTSPRYHGRAIRVPEWGEVWQYVPEGKADSPGNNVLGDC